MSVDELLEQLCADDLVRVSFTAGVHASTGLQPGVWKYAGADQTDHGIRLWFTDPEHPAAAPVAMVATWLARSAYSFEFVNVVTA